MILVNTIVRNKQNNGAVKLYSTKQYRVSYQNKTYTYVLYLFMLLLCKFYALC